MASMASESEVFARLGTYKIIAPRGFTDTGRLHKFQTRTVSKLADAASRLRDELNVSLYEVITQSYTEGTGTMAETTKASLKATSRDRVEVEVVTGAAHAVYLTAYAGLPFPSPGHKIPRAPGYLRFFWKSGPQGAGVYQFFNRQVNWRPHNIAPGSDPVGEVLSYYADQFQSVMLRTHDTALADFVAENNADMAEVA